MEETNHDWLTFHRVRHPAAQGLEAHSYIETPIASCIRMGYDGVIRRNPTTEIWVGWCIHHSLDDAEAALSSPETIFPFMANAEESWHALLLPYAHRGAVNWRGKVEVDAALRTGPDPGGPLVVITSAGYDSVGPEEMPRITEFIGRLTPAQAFLQKADGNVRAAMYAACDDRDGITFTLWESESAMVAAAYGTGEHRAQIMHHRAEPLFDRSSFTRARVIRSFGSWDGSDPAKH